MEVVCRVKAKPEPKVTWYKNGEALKESSVEDVGRNEARTKLLISKASLEDEGEYSVEAENTVETCEASFRITGNCS